MGQKHEPFFVLDEKGQGAQPYNLLAYLIARSMIDLSAELSATFASEFLRFGFGTSGAVPLFSGGGGGVGGQHFPMSAFPSRILQAVLLPISRQYLVIIRQYGNRYQDFRAQESN